MTQTKVASTKNAKPVQVRSMAKGLGPGDKLPKRRNRLKKYPPLTRKQQRLVEEHLWIAGRLAHSARSLTGGFTGCYTREDLESVALFALCVAATRYDADLGWKFSTFAWNTCRGWIQHALRDYSRMVKVPRWIGGVRQEVRALASNGLTYAEIAEELGLEESQVVQCEESWQEIHSSYDHTPDDARPKEFIYEVDEVKAMLGPRVFEQVGDFSDADIKLLLLHVEGELECEIEKERAQALLENLQSILQAPK
jgi:hypothetical protein